MMFHDSRNDNVALLEIGASPCLRNKVDTLGCAARENDLAPIACVDEALDFEARFFVGGGSFFAQFVNATMYIGVVVTVIIVKCVDDHQGLLAAGGIVQ